MRHTIAAVIGTILLIILQLSIAGAFPLALISYAAWIWAKGFRAVAPWAAICAIVLDLYSTVFGVHLIIWAIILSTIAILSIAVFTNRSFSALLVVMIGSYIVGSALTWSFWYISSRIVASFAPLSLWYDSHIVFFILGIVMTAAYAGLLWLTFAGGKRSRRAFMVHDQAV